MYSAASSNSSSVADKPRVQQKPGFSRSARRISKRKILHISRPDLRAVAVFFYQINAMLVHRLR
jgi:hypothetical protein